MNAQWALVALIVGASALYAAWTLMPASLRRVVATAALRLPLPRTVAARMRAHAENASSCGCSGCDRNPLSAGRESDEPAPTVRPITVHRRRPG